MKKLFILIAVFAVTALAGTASAQNFEGVIKFRKATKADTSEYIYYVKGDKVRIQTFTAKGEKSGSTIVDTKKGTKMILLPDKKLYSVMPNKDYKYKNDKLEITKTDNKKTIHGYECTLVRVKDPERKIEVSYWVADKHFDFFEPFLKILGRQENFATFYLNIDAGPGAFSFLAVERTLLREEKGRLEVTEIKEEKVSDDMFAIPEGYVEYKR